MSNAIVWFRQDLRLKDNPAFVNACEHSDHIIPLYILDESSFILGEAQRWWLHHSLISLDNDLKKIGLTLCLRKGNTQDILQEIVNQHAIESIYWNRCYEPDIIQRDTLIKKTFQDKGLHIQSSNGSLLHEPWEIKNTSGNFFKVFSPYWKACLKKLIIPNPLLSYQQPRSLNTNTDTLDSWKLLPDNPNWAAAFEDYWRPGEQGAEEKLADFISLHLKGYNTSRDEPAKNSTSKLSPHLHFGEISPWQVFRAIENVKLEQDCDVKSIERFLSEMGWREFSYHLLYYVPSLPVANFKSEFDAFPWQLNPVFLKNWQQGKTGYPIVDAGMRELWHTGYMHNRVRMIVASFLIKDLFIDWRVGASWFFNTLLDADLANNSASWQWVAGSGADAAPYFRIFNPVLQGEKFDPNGEYIKRWVPELKSIPIKWIHTPWLAPKNNLNIHIGQDYPAPIVDHSEARKAALDYYKMIKSNITEDNN